MLEVGHEDTGAVLDALASATGRALFESLYEQPATPSEVAERLDTSIQNVHYHLEQLQAAGLVEGIDTAYSDRGHEMTVYGPTSDPIVLVSEASEGLDARLAEVAGGVGLLALGSLLVQFAVESLAVSRGEVSDVVWPASHDPVGGEDPSWLAELAVEVAEPGVLFFLGGLAVAAAVWLRRR